MSRSSDMRDDKKLLPRPRLLAGVAKAIWPLIILLTTIYCGGFLVYVAEYQRAAQPPFDRADAIVVLTGGPERIAEAARLLAEKHAARLFISGVNEQTDEDDLVRTVPLLTKFMTCCVTIDRRSMNTHDNAVETILWAKKNNITSLILVTAHAHLPRAMFEFRISGGDMLQIAPWRVGGPQHPEEWWRDAKTIRVMLVEYTKLIGSVMRYFFVSLRGET